jgi:hypothetical protein
MDAVRVVGKHYKRSSCTGFQFSWQYLRKLSSEHTVTTSVQAATVLRSKVIAFVHTKYKRKQGLR